MKILDILPKESIISELLGRSKREVLEELADALLKQKPQLDRRSGVRCLVGTRASGEHRDR